jgi:hypothetical protein
MLQHADTASNTPTARTCDKTYRAGCDIYSAAAMAHTVESWTL